MLKKRYKAVTLITFSMNVDLTNNDAKVIGSG